MNNPDERKTKTPHELADERIYLAEEYSRYSGEYARHIKLQAAYFNANRGSHKSDTACQHAFDVTDEGVTLVVLKLKLKSIEKRLSATATMLRLCENEAKSLY
jgi:hypothetical protein